LGGIRLHVRTKCDGNVHFKGAFETTANSLGLDAPRNAAYLASDSHFWPDNNLGQWISWDFEALRTEPTCYPTRRYGGDRNCHHPKSWAVEGSDEGVSWTDIDWREKNSDFNSPYAAKAFAISRSGNLRWIGLPQTGPNHDGRNSLQLCAFEVFGAVVGLQ
jgi:hypothetical protein